MSGAEFFSNGDLTAALSRYGLYVRACVGARVRVCMCVRACVRACVRVCAPVCGS